MIDFAAVLASKPFESIYTYLNEYGIPTARDDGNYSEIRGEMYFFNLDYDCSALLAYGVDLDDLDQLEELALAIYRIIS